MTDPTAALSLASRSIVVFGGGSGIGQASAELAAGLGANVTVVDLDGDTAASVADDLGGVGLAGDACDPVQVASLLGSVASARGVDAVITTVGGADLGTLDELDPARWQAELDFNLSSVYAVTRAAVPHLRERGGAIVTTSSGYADLPAPDRPGYAAAKAGVISFTRSVAAGHAAAGIRVNCVAPGPTDTPRFRAMNGGDEGVERVRQAMPLGRIPTPEDVAWMHVFLCTDAARAITGQVVHVNGGIHMP